MTALDDLALCVALLSPSATRECDATNAVTETVVLDVLVSLLPWGFPGLSELQVRSMDVSIATEADNAGWL